MGEVNPRDAKAGVGPSRFRRLLQSFFGKLRAEERLASGGSKPFSKGTRARLLVVKERRRKRKQLAKASRRRNRGL